MLSGYFNATDFIEYCQDYDIDDGNCDYISLYISSYESDYWGTSFAIGTPFYRLLPCENLMLSVALQHNKRIDRESNRCRNEYPLNVSKIIKEKLEPEDLFNPIFAPNLPYDELTCSRLCAAAYWLLKCKCYMSFMSYRYAGSPKHLPTCVRGSKTVNCSKQHAEISTPPEVIEACECYPQCQEHSYYIINEQRQRYALGNAAIKSKQDNSISNL